MTAPAIVVRGATVALTRRTNFRKAFLAPWHPLVSDIWWYCLALAQRQTGVAIHQSTLVLNHHHTEVTGTEENLPVFKRILHGELSKALNVLLAEQRYEQPHQIWDDRATHTMRLLDAEAQAAHMVYSHVNPVAAGLVRTPSEMPGLRCDFGTWKSGTVGITRPPLYFDGWSDTELPVLITPSPLLYLGFDGDLDALVHHMRRLGDDAQRQLHTAREGRPYLGARALQRIHPWNEPRTMREPGGERVPTFKLGARGLTARRWEMHACEEVTLFRQEHREARVARLAGQDVVFPHGTYLMRVEHGAKVAEPKNGAFVAAPGKTLDEVKEQLAAERSETQREPMLGAIRKVFREEAAEIVEEEALELGSVERASCEEQSSDHAETQPQVRHRFDPPSTDAERTASRVVVLRDARRGRPRTPGPPA